MTRTLITSALPYANGAIHLGHLVEYIQTDIYVRFLRSCGEDVVYLCADDTHGTPIELAASKAKLPPEQYVRQWYDQHRRDFAAFQVGFDGYYDTNTPENRRYAELVYSRLKEAGHIVEETLDLTWCERDRRFLPDRFVRGTCPSCRAPDQYGDQCEKCNAAYDARDLIDPRCAVCGQPPTRKRSEHHQIFKLSRFDSFLREYIAKEGVVEPGIRNFARQLIDGQGLTDWCVTRDGPYFGFPVPGVDGKFFYVWLDAPIGYVSATEIWARETGKAKDAMAYWGRDAQATIIHFIGKDIVKFHVLFWPATLHGAGLKVPDRIVVHGHLTINGQKMSKSRGTFLNASDYLAAGLDPTFLRYYYAANLSPRVEDIDLSLKDFRQRVNGELANNLGNLFNRALSLLGAKFEGRVSPRRDGEEIAAALDAAKAVRQAYRDLEFRAAIRGINAIAERANRFMQSRAPWAKAETDAEAARSDLSTMADVAYLLSALLAPVTPKLSQDLTAQLQGRTLTFADLAASPALLPPEHRVGKAAPLVGRIEEKQIQTLASAGQGAAAKDAPTASSATATGVVTYDDFAKLELKVGKVLGAERVPKADKLLKLSVDLGEASPRQIVAGIGAQYAPEAIVGKNIVVVANLKPRAVRGVDSNGMLLAAGGESGQPLVLVEVPGAAPGTRVR